MGRDHAVVLQLVEQQVAAPLHGGWSFFVDVSPLDLDGTAASRLLLEKGKIAATPMTNWGTDRIDAYVRVVFSNEPVERLEGIGRRFRAAFGR